MIYIICIVCFIIGVLSGKFFLAIGIPFSDKFRRDLKRFIKINCLQVVKGNESIEVSSDLLQQFFLVEYPTHRGTLNMSRFDDVLGELLKSKVSSLTKYNAQLSEDSSTGLFRINRNSSLSIQPPATTENPEIPPGWEIL